jgi:hypothetical protein
MARDTPSILKFTSGSRNEHIKHKGGLITVAYYKKVMKSNEGIIVVNSYFLFS